MFKGFRLTTLAATGVLALAGCSGFGSSVSDKPAVSDEQSLINNATHTVGAMKVAATSKVPTLLQKAKAVVIFPDMIKGGIGIGASHGKGVLLAKTSGGWSEPAFYDSTSISLGLQIGAEESSVVMFVMTQKALDAMLQTSTFTLKAQGGLSLADLNTATQEQITGADVVVWSRSEGAFGGLALAGSDVSQATDYDKAYYGQAVTARDIIAGKVNNDKASALIKSLGS
jgi:lipid-binding SYLF domain-containing protein